jgi:hypothetical protein
MSEDRVPFRRLSPGRPPGKHSMEPTGEELRA